MDDGQWTMDDGQKLCRAFRANPNIVDPSDPSDPTDQSDQSEKPIGQITNSRAIPSIEAATPIKNFRTTRPNFFFFVQDFSEKQSPSYWYTITCQDDPSDCGAFTRHCLWVGSSPQAKARG